MKTWGRFGCGKVCLVDAFVYRFPIKHAVLKGFCAFSAEVWGCLS
jgi:predicted ATPase